MDTINLGPREAANAIRLIVQSDASSRIDPDDHHRMRFVKAVCSELALEPTPENVMHVSLVLREQGIAMQVAQEYPKWIGNGDGTPDVLVQNAEEEDKYRADREKPEERPDAEIAETDPPASDVKSDAKVAEVDTSGTVTTAPKSPKPAPSRPQ